MIRSTHQGIGDAKHLVDKSQLLSLKLQKANDWLDTLTIGLVLLGYSFIFIHILIAFIEEIAS